MHINSDGREYPRDHTNHLRRVCLLYVCGKHVLQTKLIEMDARLMSNRLIGRCRVA